MIAIATRTGTARTETETVIAIFVKIETVMKIDTTVENMVTERAHTQEIDAESFGFFHWSRPWPVGVFTSMNNMLRG